MVKAMNTVDLLVLAVLFLNGVIGAFRGFTWQVFRLGSLVLAFWLGNHYSGKLADWLPTAWLPDDRMQRSALLWVIIGVGSYLLMYGIGYIFRRWIDRARLASSDRALGFFLGAAKGAAIVALVFQVLLVFFPLLPDSVQSQLVGGSSGSPPQSQAFRLHHQLISRQLNAIVPERLQNDFERGYSDANQGFGR